MSIPLRPSSVGPCPLKSLIAPVVAISVSVPASLGHEFRLTSLPTLITSCALAGSLSVELSLPSPS